MALENPDPSPARPPRRSSPQRARVEYTVRDGRIEGTVTVAGGSSESFRNAAELEAALGIAHGRLLLVDSRETAGERSGLAQLTPTERAIAQAAATGASNREIAESFFYSVKSVEAYLTRIYKRLAVEGRSGLPAALPAESLDDLEPLDEQAQHVAGGSGAKGTPAGRATRCLQIELLLV